MDNRLIASNALSDFQTLFHGQYAPETRVELINLISARLDAGDIEACGDVGIATYWKRMFASCLLELFALKSFISSEVEHNARQ